MEKIFAQSLTLPGGNTIKTSNSGFNSLGEVISAAIPYIFIFSGIGLLLMIISSGFSLMTSAGDAKKAEGAKTRLTNAVAGFVIIFVAYWVVQIAGTIFGITEVKEIFGP